MADVQPHPNFLIQRVDHKEFHVADVQLDFAHDYIEFHVADVQPHPNFLIQRVDHKEFHVADVQLDFAYHPLD